jgi:S-adenosylmethionine decarboxylase
MEEKIMMDYAGWPHLLISGFGCSRKRLNDLRTVYDFLKHFPEKIGMKPIGVPIVYQVKKEDHPDIGITGVQIIATSHISIHTFPHGQKDGKKKPRKVERKIYMPFVTIDVYSCKDFDVAVAVDYIKKTFKPKLLEKVLIYRLREDAELIEVETE